MIAEIETDKVSESDHAGYHSSSVGLCVQYMLVCSLVMAPLMSAHLTRVPALCTEIVCDIL